MQINYKDLREKDRKKSKCKLSCTQDFCPKALGIIAPDF